MEAGGYQAALFSSASPVPLSGAARFQPPWELCGLFAVKKYRAVLICFQAESYYVDLTDHPGSSKVE